MLHDSYKWKLPALSCFASLPPSRADRYCTMYLKTALHLDELHSVKYFVRRTPHPINIHIYSYFVEPCFHHRLHAVQMYIHIRYTADRTAEHGSTLVRQRALHAEVQD